jgi:hypothetical protein
MNLKYKHLLNKSVAPPAGYSETAEAVFALMDSDPPVWLKNKMNTYINGLVSDGNWTLLKQLLFYAMDTEANSLVDWLGFVNAVNVNSTPHTPVTEAHVGFAGYTTNGTTNYLNRVLKPSDMVQNNIFVSSYLFETLSAANSVHLFSSRVLNGLNMFIRQNTTPNKGYCVNSSSVNTRDYSASLFQNNKLYTLSREVSTDMRVLENGVEQDTINQVSTTPSAQPIWDSVLNANGTPSSFFSGKICMVASGKGIGFNHLAFYNRTLAFLQDLGIET